MSKPVYIKILLLTVLTLALACKKEVDISSPVSEVQTVHYKASVQTEADTKATVGTDLKYKYETGDRVYMESEDGELYGFLSMVVDAPGNDVALFEGDLNYVGETSSADYINSNPAVKLVLVSKDDYLHTIKEGKVIPVDAETESYPKDKWASSLEEAVSHLSHFTGTGHFNDYTFTLRQKSSFLKCFVRMKSDEAPVGETIEAQLQAENGDILREASVEIAEAGVVPFVFAFLGGESLSAGTKLLVKWGDTSEKEKFFDVSSKTLAANTFYNISRSTLSFDGFRIRVVSDGTNIKFNYPLKYSLDFGETWTDISASSSLSSLKAGNVVCLKGDNTNYKNAGSDQYGTPSNKPIFEANYKCFISGNIMSLLKDETLVESAFQGAFSKGTTAISYIDIDPDSPLILPATSLVKQCYMQMFRNCTSLTKAPTFTVEQTAYRCCYNMFRQCSSLSNIQNILLPAETMYEDCYRELFRLCTSLTEVDANLLPARTLAKACYQQMFNGCTRLKNTPNLPATVLAESCYDTMFSACSTIEKAPKLSAATLVTSCYYQMFNGCSKLNEVTCLATDGFSATKCTENWITGVGSTGKFTKAQGVESWPRGASGIPNGWEIIDYSE
jgi:hypothetical protein